MSSVYKRLAEGKEEKKNVSKKEKSSKGGGVTRDSVFQSMVMGSPSGVEQVMKTFESILSIPLSPYLFTILWGRHH